MSIDGFVTFLTLLVGVYALMPTLSKKQVKLEAWLQFPIGFFALAAVISLLVCGLNIPAFFATIAWVSAALLMHRFIRPRGNLKTLLPMLEEMSINRDYLEIIEIIVFHKRRIGRALDAVVYGKAGKSKSEAALAIMDILRDPGLREFVAARRPLILSDLPVSDFSQDYVQEMMVDVIQRMLRNGSHRIHLELQGYEPYATSRRNGVRKDDRLLCMLIDPYGSGAAHISHQIAEQATACINGALPEAFNRARSRYSPWQSKNDLVYSTIVLIDLAWHVEIMKGSGCSLVGGGGLEDIMLALMIAHEEVVASKLYEDDAPTFAAETALRAYEAILGWSVLERYGPLRNDRAHQEAGVLAGHMLYQAYEFRKSIGGLFDKMVGKAVMTLINPDPEGVVVQSNLLEAILVHAENDDGYASALYERRKEVSPLAEQYVERLRSIVESHSKALSDI